MTIDVDDIARQHTTTVRAFNTDLVCLKNERIATRIARHGIYEQIQTAIVPLFAKFGTNVFDVGANIGYYTAFLSMLVGTRGRVHSFEANPVTARFLSMTKENNGLENVIVNNLAVSDSSESLMVSYAPDFDADRDAETFNLGAWSLFKRKPGSVKIDCTTLDAYCESNRMKAVSFIKVDVEGFEDRVLRGAESMMRQFRPAIMIEFNAKSADSHALNMQVVEQLKKIDYKIARLCADRYPYLRTLAESDFSEVPYGFYIVALHSDDAKIIHG